MAPGLAPRSGMSNCPWRRSLARPKYTGRLKVAKQPIRKDSRVAVGSQVKEPIHGFFCCYIGTNLRVLLASFRSALILQSKLSLASIDPDGHYGIVVLAIAAISQLISATDLGVGIQRTSCSERLSAK